MAKTHTYESRIVWTGNSGEGTRTYRGYDRTWDIAVPGKPVIGCSNDPILGGDPGLMNPEDLLLSSLSACHMLWYLHLASESGISVLTYEDMPTAIGEMQPGGAGRFLEATLHPAITIEAGGDVQRAHDIHGEIHKVCFVARSVNFPVSYDPVIRVQQY